MNKTKKNLPINYIFGIAVIVIVIVGGIFYWISQKSGEKGPAPQGEEQPADRGGRGEVPQVLNMAAIVSSVDTQRNVVSVKAAEGGKEIKLYVSSDTEIIQLKFPFDPKNPPAKETTFTPQRIPVTIKDLEADDRVLVETRTSIYGKTEINDVTRIQVLP